jgi:hypothetical protein
VKTGSQKVKAGTAKKVGAASDTSGKLRLKSQTPLAS